MNNPISFLRKATLVEGVSFLLLLGIAMPLKYFADLPIAVKVVGWIHGALFMIVCVALVRTKIVARWSLGRTAMVLIAALLPFGPFVVDRRIKQYLAEFNLRET